MKKLLSLVKQLIKRRGGTLFDAPVDPEAFGIPDYWEIVDRPIDLGTVLKWIEANAYDRSRGLAHEEIADDVRFTILPICISITSVYVILVLVTFSCQASFCQRNDV